MRGLAERERPRRGRRWTAAPGPLAAALLLLGAAPVRGEAPVLHEYVRVRRDAPPATVGEPRAGQNPQAIRRGDRLLPAPTDPPHPTAGEQTLTPPPARPTALDRATSFRPDRATGPESTLRYHTVFNPSVVPFKRVEALDLVRPDGTLTVADRALRPVPVGGAPRPGGELFFGSAMVALGGGPVPLPSVAPEVRILSYETTPRTKVTFYRDGADNYFVEGRRHGAVRLTWLSEAPASYFSGAVPEAATLRDVPRAWLRPVPPAFRDRAAPVLARIGVDRQAALPVVLDRLVAYFRAFQPGVLPPGHGNLYLDLALAQKGVCRHRAYAFVVTAAALGLPARFVSNEAHAFVEVRLPGPGWRRIDLGGAADLLQVSGAGDKVVHRARVPDPFPRPPAYRAGATRIAGAGAVRGLRDDQVRELRTPGGAAPPGRRPPGPGGAERAAGTPSPAAAAAEPGAPAPVFPLAVRTETRLTAHRSSGFRGEPLAVAGRVRAVRGSAAGLRVEVHLRPLAGGRGRVLGTLTTDVAGHVAGTFTLPVDLELGDYRLVLVTVGDPEHLGSSTE